MAKRPIWCHVAESRIEPRRGSSPWPLRTKVLGAQPDHLANGESPAETWPGESDFLDWQQGVGTSISATHAQGDADRDGDVDGGDLNLWKNAYSAASIGQTIPEPASAAIMLPLVGLALARKRAVARRQPS